MSPDLPDHLADVHRRLAEANQQLACVLQSVNLGGERLHAVVAQLRAQALVMHHERECLQSDDPHRRAEYHEAMARHARRTTELLDELAGTLQQLAAELNS